MKAEIQFVNRNAGCLRVRRLLGLAVALRYCLAAQRDEKNGFPLTAAMEWHEAADLFVPMAPVANLCWRRWERIMQLPRHLAVPISDPLPCDAPASQRALPAPSGEERFLLSA